MHCLSSQRSWLWKYQPTPPHPHPRRENSKTTKIENFIADTVVASPECLQWEREPGSLSVERKLNAEPRLSASPCSGVPTARAQWAPDLMAAVCWSACCFSLSLLRVIRAFSFALLLATRLISSLIQNRKHNFRRSLSRMCRTERWEIFIPNVINLWESDAHCGCWRMYSICNNHYTVCI